MESKRTQKTFVETFGEARAATVESGSFSPTGRLRGQRPQLQKIRIRNHHPGGKAATVAGYAGPGFHNWPSGHIDQGAGSETPSSHLPQRGNAYQPWASPWEPHPKE